MTRLGYLPDASRSEKVRWLVARCEPLLLVALALQCLIAAAVLSESLVVYIGGLGGCAFGLFGLVNPTNRRLGLLRATYATALLMAVAWVLPDPQVVDLVPWFSILGIGYPLVFGLRRAYPFIIANSIGIAVAGTKAFSDTTSGLLRVPVVVIGGILAGLIADALEEATASASAATRDAVRAKTSENYLRTVLNTAPIGILVIGSELEDSFMNARIAEFLNTAPVLSDVEALRSYLDPADQHIFEAIRATVANGETATYSCRLLLARARAAQRADRGRAGNRRERPPQRHRRDRSRHERRGRPATRDGAFPRRGRRHDRPRRHRLVR